ncbi:MAG: nucleoside kinase [Sphaerochaetaceae bacterium]|nr:nucleoside kinase [Sphaerochaetaceae bacterium]
MQNNITITTDNKKTTFPKGVTIHEMFNSGISTEYEDNPYVAALVNGELKNLGFSILYDAEVKPIRLFSSLGKRVYRHTLALVLSYAVSKTYPDSHFVVDYALGDGHCFHFEDKEVDEKVANNLTKVMQKAIDDNLEITYKAIPYTKALEIFNGKAFPRTNSLLETRNDAKINVCELDGYQDVVYEPVLPSTGLLKIWELRAYKNTLLLRHPIMKDYKKITDFENNDKLFDVLNRERQNCKVMKVTSIGELNKAIADGSINHIIELSETIRNSDIDLVARDITNRGSVKAVFLAGPSSSGKTTTSLKLSSRLELFGYKPIKISLDDYYLPGEDSTPLDEDGKPDYEALDALDVAYFKKQLSELFEGKSIHLPVYTFKTHSRRDAEKETVLKENSILIIEGIHGLNPALFSSFAPENIYKVYVSALTGLTIDDHNRISTTDTRIIRRCVRDARTRGFSAESTLQIWPSVERGEKNNIFPFQNNADAMLSSSLVYELAALAPYAISLLRSVKPQSGEAYTNARRLLKFLELIYIVNEDRIPLDSVLREFIGGSIYGAV